MKEKKNLIKKEEEGTERRMKTRKRARGARTRPSYYDDTKKKERQDGERLYGSWGRNLGR